MALLGIQSTDEPELVVQGIGGKSVHHPVDGVIEGNVENGMAHIDPDILFLVGECGYLLHFPEPDAVGPSGCRGHDHFGKTKKKYGA